MSIIQHAGTCASQAMRLGCLMPKNSGKEYRVAIPLVLPLGWTESSPYYFCAAAEIIVDITNAPFINAPKHPPHRLERYNNFNENITPTIPTRTPAMSRCM
jgi:hypothetical protein